ncbi:MAG: riboflavin synthase [Xanthomonadales bacterium]|nr:riboflavin synthase [Xanthomonadales bacterium]NIX13252.1 riboflavin synthase [Xanthomonadales bacterium]
MFTGIVTHRGRLAGCEERGGDLRMAFGVPTEHMRGCSEGDSIAVNGVCLTMIAPSEDGFSADVSTETLDCTTLGRLVDGDLVNLELPLRPADRLGGHLVSGHVDGKAVLVSRHADARAERFEFELPMKFSRYVAEKGSITLDGVSLTINDAEGRRFGVCLIPHTLEVTSLGGLQPGDEVNVEVDMIARYLERLLATDE